MSFHEPKNHGSTNEHVDQQEGDEEDSSNLPATEGTSATTLNEIPSDSLPMHEGTTLVNVNETTSLLVDSTTSTATATSTSIRSQRESNSTTTVGGGDSSEPPLPTTAERHMRYLDEMDRPWPATFERSISLLAGPTMDTTFIDQVTKSPKITPNLPMRAQMNVYNTPDRNKFKPGIAKMQSLDFPSNIQAAKNDFDKRAMEAKLYRMNTLMTVEEKKGRTGQTETKKPVKKDPHGSNTSDEKASFGQCVFNMANILMGVGMLGLPFVFKSAGWVGGFFVTLIFSSVAWRTSILLGRELNGDPRPCSMFPDDPFKSPIVPGSKPGARMRRPIHSFPDIAREAFGNVGTILLSLVLYFELFSCLCIFLVTLGDHLHTLYPKISIIKHMIHLAIILTIPTALLRTPKLLSYLSAVGTVATILVVSCVVYEAWSNGDISETVAKHSSEPVPPPYHKTWDSAGLPIAFGLIAYTFSGHAIVPSIYDSMKNKKDFEKMIGVTFVLVLTSCLAVAVGGYYMFGSTVDDQITLSLEKNGGSDNMLLTVLTWMMILTAFSKFTLTAFPLALGMEEIVAPFLHSEGAMEVISSLIKLLLIFLALVVAIYVPSFSFICSLVGLICTMTVSVIFPAAAHLKLFGPSLAWWDKGIDYMFILSGTIMAIAGTATTVIQNMEENGR